MDPVIAAAASLVPVPGGRITLQDERTKKTWRVDVEPFWLGRVPVTRALYHAVLGTPATGSPQAPMTDVSWNDAVHFCNALSRAAGLAPCYGGLGDPEARAVTVDATADGYHLPTEAEWEHACRADDNAARYGALSDIAWWADNAGGVVHDVGTRAENAWGLFDTLGNVWEWCFDVYDPVVYGGYRVFRGGGFADGESACRASCRRKSHPTFRIDDLGFRLARRAP